MRSRRSPRGRRLWLQQRDQLLEAELCEDDEAEESATNSTISDGTESRSLDITEDLEICDELPRALRRCLHEMVCTFSAEVVREVYQVRRVDEIIYNLRLQEQREVERFYQERNLTYVGTICRYYSHRVYNRVKRAYR